jgi:hypothetical protein
MRTVLALLVLLVPGSASTPPPSPNLSDLKDLSKIEKMIPLGDNKYSSEIRREFKSLREALTKTPVAQRPDALNKLAQQTKWGTSQRFIVYYVCAWYGVNYVSTRDSLTHAAFWWEWYIGRPEDQHPFSFDDVSVDLLYALYEHNHDFKILHDILTTQSDAGTAELIIGFTDDAIVKHPRGVLHVAGMSAKGRSLAYDLLHLSPRDENHPLYILYGTEDSLKKFRAYVTRVANDPKDPLNPVAKDLLKKRRGRR